MESASLEELRLKLFRALSHEAAGTDPKVVAAAVMRLHDALADRLSQLIGDLGVSAVWARSVHLTQREYSWLARTPQFDHEDPLTHLRLSLERQPAATAAAAAASLFSTFCSLLGTLIGNGLTMRLMREAWPDIASGETDQEQTLP